jgi:hypothetical protein
MKHLLTVTLVTLLVTSVTFGQTKTKITLTCEKDSISVQQLCELSIDIQKLEKKYGFYFKIEFESKKYENIGSFYINSQSDTAKFKSWEKVTPLNYLTY